MHIITLILALAMTTLSLFGLAEESITAGQFIACNIMSGLCIALLFTDNSFPN